MRDIRDEIDKLGYEIGQSIFGLTEYVDKFKGNSHMCLKWTEKGRKFIYDLLKRLEYIDEN